MASQNKVLLDAIQQLSQSNASIAESMKGIKELVKDINDKNILHITQTTEEHKIIESKLTMFANKYWWLLLIVVSAIIVLAGAQKVLEFIKIS